MGYLVIFLLLGPFSGLVSYVLYLLQVRPSARVWREKLLGYSDPVPVKEADLSRDMRRFWRTVLLVEITVLLMGQVVNLGYTKVYLGLSVFDWCYIPVSITGLLLWHDAYMYWVHRLMHHPRLFIKVHRHHHEGSGLSAWTALAFSVLEASIYIVGILFPLFVVPLHPLSVLLFLALGTMWGLLSHAGASLAAARAELVANPDSQDVIEEALAAHKPSWIVDSFYHDFHHEVYTAHFGMYFTFWDRVQKTESPVYRERYRT